MSNSNRPTDKRHRPTITRRRRCIMASDSEWAAITQRAEDAGLSISALVRQRLIHEPAAATPPPHAAAAADPIPPSLQWQMLHAILHQHKLWAARYEDLGASDDFNRLSREVETLLRSTRKLG